MRTEHDQFHAVFFRKAMDFPGRCSIQKVPCFRRYIELITDAVQFLCQFGLEVLLNLVHADEDQAKRKLIDQKNEAEARIHAARKSMEDLGDDLDSGLKEDVETKIKALEEVLKGDDPDMIQAASDALMTSVQQLASAAYEKASAGQGTAEEPDPTEPGPEETDKKEKSGKDGAVDADYEVVD